MNDSISRRTLLKAAACGAAVLAFPVRDARASLSAAEIALRSSQVDKVMSWVAQCRIEMRAPNATTRVRKGTISNRLRDNDRDALRLYHFTYPADLEGTRLLIHEDQATDDALWLYLPAAGKTRRIVSSAKKNSFLGSEFAYVDLMTQRVDDFEHTLAGREAVDGVDCHVVDSVPSTDAWADDIGYSRQRAWVRADELATLQIDYYDLKGQHAKRQRLTELHVADASGGKFIAKRRHMVNVQSGRDTLMQFLDLEVNAPINDRDFSPSRLGRR